MRWSDVPDWLRDALLALGAFVGGRSINALGEMHKERVMMRDTMSRLALGVETISGDLKEIRGEIHAQVGNLKVEIHDQVSALKQELHAQQLSHERRVETIESRVDFVNSRVDSLTAAEGILINRGEGWKQRSRLQWEQACRPGQPSTEGADHGTPEGSTES